MSLPKQYLADRAVASVNDQAVLMSSADLFFIDSASKSIFVIVQVLRKWYVTNKNIENYDKKVQSLRQRWRTQADMVKNHGQRHSAVNQYTTNSSWRPCVRNELPTWFANLPEFDAQRTNKTLQETRTREQICSWAYKKDCGNKRVWWTPWTEASW